MVGDIVHAAEVQFSHPNVTADFDAGPAQARATRERTLSELAETHELVAAEHVSFPGLGHVTQNGSGYQWTRSLTRGRSPRRPSDPLPRDWLPVIHLSGIHVAGPSASA
ncbi:hypothetical protein L0F51_13885 [Afifella sp. H1R]|uniref:hypothetical protein n=1 Tax=Afifella sp. H1R TaxID=2908841 RepID=UPI001F35B8B3|nr:hypothetical protein [Afifella sp. H1R]MCF1504841.1 hypothetical protein [Afifella sp. H1R]